MKKFRSEKLLKIIDRLILLTFYDFNLSLFATLLQYLFKSLVHNLKSSLNKPLTLF